jgi:hypothetical protein
LDFEGLLRALEEREPEDRLATVPDFFVEEVRLDAAAARFVVDLDALRDFFAEDLAAPRLELRAAGFLAADERAELERAELERAEVEREAGFLAADEVERAEVFFAADLVPDFAEVFLAAVFLAAVFVPVLLRAPVLAEDFAAVREVDLAAVFLAAVFVPDFLAAVLFEPDFEALFVALERDEVPVDFAAVLRELEVPDFLAPDLAEDEVPFAALVELRRALLFFVDFLVLVAPVSPVNNIVSGFDLSSVGIAASFKGLRVQPSRLQGNVVIPMRFRLSESLDSRTHAFSVDMLIASALFTCSHESREWLRDERVRVFSAGRRLRIMVLTTHNDLLDLYRKFNRLVG